MDSAPARTRRTLSPRAPGITLGDAIKDVGRAYDRYGHGQFSRGELASALGMSASGGAFAGKYAALNEFSLVDDLGGRLRVTNTYMTLRSSSPGSPEARVAALSAIQSSNAFSRLLAQFPQRVPEVAAIALRLETQERFNPQRASVVAQAFRESLTEFGLVDGLGNLLDVVAAAADDPGISAPVPAPGPPSQETGAVPAGQFKVEVPLGDGRRANLYLPDDLATVDVRKIRAILDAYVSEEAS